MDLENSKEKEHADTEKEKQTANMDRIDYLTLLAEMEHR